MHRLGILRRDRSAGAFELDWQDVTLDGRDVGRQTPTQVRESVVALADDASDLGANLGGGSVLLNGTVGKMAMGLAWDLSGYTVEDLNEPWAWGLSWNVNAALQHIPADDVLYAARVSSAVLTIASVWAVFAITLAVLPNHLAAWTASLIYATTPAVLPGSLAIAGGYLYILDLLGEDGATKPTGAAVLRIADDVLEPTVIGYTAPAGTTGGILDMPVLESSRDGATVLISAAAEIDGGSGDYEGYFWTIPGGTIPGSATYLGEALGGEVAGLALAASGRTAYVVDCACSALVWTLDVASGVGAVLDLSAATDLDLIAAAVASPDDIVRTVIAARETYVAPELRAYIVSLVEATRAHDDAFLGASPRGSLALYNLSRGLAYLRGREYVTPDDIKFLAQPALGHRIVMHPSARMAGREGKDVVADALRQVSVPGGAREQPRRRSRLAAMRDGGQ